MEQKKQMTTSYCETILNCMRIGASRTEREAIEYAIKKMKSAKKAKRWKRKYLRLMEICKTIKADPSMECNYCIHLGDGINDFFCDECCHNYMNKFKPNTKGEQNVNT